MLSNLLTMSSIEERISVLESALLVEPKAAAQSGELLAYKKSILLRLKAIRHSLDESPSGANADLELEVQALRKENSQLKYRIAHLLKALDDQDKLIEDSQ